MKRLAHWLSEKAFFWMPYPTQAIVELWACILTPIIMIGTYLLMEDVTLPFQLLFGGIPALVLIVTVVYDKLIKKTKWRPEVFFATLYGIVQGGLIGIFIKYFFL